MKTPWPKHPVIYEISAWVWLSGKESQLERCSVGPNLRSKRERDAGYRSVCRTEAVEIPSF